MRAPRSGPDEPHPFRQPSPVEQPRQRILDGLGRLGGEPKRHLQSRRRGPERLAHLPDGVRQHRPAVRHPPRHRPDGLLMPEQRCHLRRRVAPAIGPRPAQRIGAGRFSLGARGDPRESRLRGEQLSQGASVRQPRDTDHPHAGWLRCGHIRLRPCDPLHLVGQPHPHALHRLDGEPLLHLCEVVQHRPAADTVKQRHQVGADAGLLRGGSVDWEECARDRAAGGRTQQEPGVQPLCPFPIALGSRPKPLFDEVDLGVGGSPGGCEALVGACAEARPLRLDGPDAECAGRTAQPLQRGIGKEVRGGGFRRATDGRRTAVGRTPAEEVTDRGPCERKEPGCGHRIHPRWRNQRKMVRQTTTMSPIVIGYPNRQPSSGMNWKFMP